ATILDGGVQVNRGATVNGGLSVHGGIAGSGAGLTSLPAGQLTGIVPAASLPGNLVTNHQSSPMTLEGGMQGNSGATVYGGLSAHGGITLADSQFTGNGAGLTGMNAAGISSGTLADARLSGNVPLLNGNQVFAGSNVFRGVSSFTNAQNQYIGT